MRKSRIGEIHKIRPNNQNVDQVREERDVSHARLLNFGTPHTVEMTWNLNESAIADQIFILKIGNKKAFLAKEDLLRFLRWV